MITNWQIGEWLLGSGVLLGFLTFPLIRKWIKEGEDEANWRESVDSIQIFLSIAKKWKVRKEKQLIADIIMYVTLALVLAGQVIIYLDATR